MQVFFSKIFDTFLKIQKRAHWSLCSKTIFCSATAYTKAKKMASSFLIMERLTSIGTPRPDQHTI
jgi:hypothetical protein